MDPSSDSSSMSGPLWGEEGEPSPLLAFAPALKINKIQDLSQTQEVGEYSTTLGGT